MAAPGEYDHLLKLVLVGDTGVGKSSLLIRFTDGIFDDSQTATIGVDFKLAMMNIARKRCKICIWDTAGQERFRTLVSSYYRGAHGIIFVYDVTRPESFHGLKAWMTEIETYLPNGGADVVKLLVGNKIDKAVDRAVSTKEGEAWARAHGMLFLESSAKSAENVKECFQEVVARVLESPVLLAGTGLPAARPGLVRPDLSAPPPGKEAGGAGTGCC